jgi:manganese transport protein
LKSGNQLYLAAGILGATVMPHNLYLHSSLVQTRQWPEGAGSQRQALGFSSLDTAVALSLAFMINASILILAAGRFHDTQLGPVSDLSQAYDLLSPSLGTSLASTLFAVALLASGQSSTLTATMAGQIVMEGFLHIRLPDWQRRLLTRSLALVPALATVLWLGDGATNPMLVLSQVVLSLQLPFAAIPLVLFCSRPELMGTLKTPLWLLLASWTCVAVIVLINATLVINLVLGR